MCIRDRYQRRVRGLRSFLRMIVCVAVVGKGNNPLYLQNFNFTPTNELKFHYIVHTALDVIEEKVQKNIGTDGKQAAQANEMYLGLLYPIEDYKVYGYMTNTKIKFIVVLDDNSNDKKDAIRSVSTQTQ
eukprot:TRINITY_DN209_c0_g1_i4.p1 TRINITY_DN209_c0_g1~~TRINITY_DN209_c0_g1_i4.p1  ORF type:complete len:129 (-),score=26.08 TRINITY_DN209_c0_g1_i4:414-800(-)